MHEKSMENMYILCGLSNEASDEIRTALTEAAKEKGYNAVCVSRYRKEGIRQFISEHKEFRILVLQEAMQTSYPYTAEELAELADDFHLNIVISLKKSHRANTYMKVLYTAGILNALYEEDATAENIMTRILYPRTRRECRDYYQITTAADAMRSLEIVDEERLKGYLTYLEESFDSSEMRSKYRYIAQSLKPVENIYLVQNLSESVRKVVATEEMYQEIMSLQEKKKKWTFGKKNKERPKQGEKREIVNFPGQISISSKMEESEIQSREEHAIEDMLDEDISDLLGFGSEVKLSKQQTAEICSSVVVDEEERTGEAVKFKGKRQPEKKQGSRNREEFIRQGVLLTGILLFLALVILFGIFLYSEYQKEETSEPAIYEQPAERNTKLDQEMESELKNISKQKKEQKETAEDTGGSKEPKQEETAVPAETAEKEVQQMVSSKEQGKENIRPPQYTQEAPAKPEPPESVVEETEQPPASSKEQENEVSYDGRILTGAEVKSIARNEEAKGIRLYLKTRDRGKDSLVRQKFQDWLMEHAVTLSKAPQQGNFRSYSNKNQQKQKKGECPMADTPSLNRILTDLERLDAHVKTYSTGAFPAYFLQLHSVLKIQDILDMQLADVYFWEDGMIKILPEIIYAGEKIILDANERKELAWYALQRIPVCETREEVLEDWLCVNKQGNQLQMPAYRKMLERASAELGFKENYNVGYLHCLYGYLKIASGKKTIKEVAREYDVTRYYLLNRIFKGMEIQYQEDVIRQVANIKESES